MTDKDKLEKLKKLANAMYYAAQQLTTDASRLHKAMDEYHKFIIHECKNVPVSEGLQKAMYLDENGNPTPAKETEYTKGFLKGANWQKEKDQSTIELAEDHAMLAGMEKMKEQMMKETVDGTVFTQLEDGEIMVRSHYFKSEKFNYLDEVKLIIIKEE